MTFCSFDMLKDEVASLRSDLEMLERDYQHCRSSQRSSDRCYIRIRLVSKKTGGNRYLLRNEIIFLELNI